MARIEGLACTIYCQACNSSQVVQWKRIHLPMQETQETWVRSLGQEDPLEKEIATHSSVLAWRIPLPEEPGGLQSMVLQRIGRDWTTEHALSFLAVGLQAIWVYDLPLNLWLRPNPPPGRFCSPPALPGSWELSPWTAPRSLVLDKSQKK